VSKLSISIPAELVDDIRDLADGNVSAFVTTAIRHEVDRRRLFGFVQELEAEFGPPAGDEVNEFVEIFTELTMATGGDHARGEDSLRAGRRTVARSGR
jgi:hypothetical protein